MHTKRNLFLRGAIAAAALLVCTGTSAMAQTGTLLQQILSRGTIRIAILPSLPPYSKLPQALVPLAVILILAA